MVSTKVYLKILFNIVPSLLFSFLNNFSGGGDFGVLKKIVDALLDVSGLKYLAFLL